MNTYVVMAHRWGSTNDHSFPIHAGLDKEAALEAAGDYPSYRGGKYGCEVIEFGGAENDEGKRIAYYPSFCGENEPEFDWLRQQLNHLGHVMWTAQRNKEVWLPERSEEHNCIILKPHAIEPPQWLVDEVVRAMEYVESAMRARKAK